jgi:hypothetical protein
MAFLDDLTNLRHARRDLADHNERVAAADENGDWETKDELREADFEHAAAVVEELDKIVDLLSRTISWAQWRQYLPGALDHAESMPDDAPAPSIQQVIADLETASSTTQPGL